MFDIQIRHFNIEEEDAKRHTGDWPYTGKEISISFSSFLDESEVTSFNYKQFVLGVLAFNRFCVRIYSDRSSILVTNLRDPFECSFNIDTPNSLLTNTLNVFKINYGDLIY